MSPFIVFILLNFNAFLLIKWSLIQIVVRYKFHWIIPTFLWWMNLEKLLRWKTRFSWVYPLPFPPSQKFWREISGPKYLYLILHKKHDLTVVKNGVKHLYLWYSYVSNLRGEAILKKYRKVQEFENIVTRGSSIKNVRSHFAVLDPHPNCTCAYAFSLHAFPLSTSVQLWFFKEDVTKIYFFNYFQLKHHKQRYKIKKVMHKSIWECRIEIPRRALESMAHFLTIRGR